MCLPADTKDVNGAGFVDGVVRLLPAFAAAVLAAGTYNEGPARAVQGEGAAEFVVCLGVRALDVRLLLPGGAGAREQIRGAGFRRGLVLLVSVDARRGTVFERRTDGSDVAVAAEGHARAEPVVEAGI